MPSRPGSDAGPGSGAAAVSKHGRERGQAAVELALGLPLVFVAMLAVVQLVLVARDQLAVVHAAREGARAAAVDPAPGAAGSAALAAVGIDAGRVSVSAARFGDRVRVQVTARVPTDVPLVGRLIPELTVRGEATMRVEP